MNPYPYIIAAGLLASSCCGVNRLYKKYIEPDCGTGPMEDAKSYPPVAEPVFRCAWCQPPSDEPNITHGICNACRDRLEREGANAQ